MDDREERIRRRAHQLWESEGEPHGRDRDHWQEAEREIDDSGGAVPEVREGNDAGDDPRLAAEPANEDAKLDVALDETFPASDPPAQTVPAKGKARRKSPMTDPGSPGGTAGTGNTAREQDR